MRRSAKRPAKRRASASPKPRAKSAQPRKRAHAGVVVNAEIKLPRPPGPWVDEVKNYFTGERFEDFRSGVTFEDGREYVRRANAAAGIAGDGYKSRGPILWAMHVLKLQEWYLHSMGDGALWDTARRRPLELRPKRSKRVAKKKPRTYRADARWGF